MIFYAHLLSINTTNSHEGIIGQTYLKHQEEIDGWYTYIWGNVHGLPVEKNGTHGFHILTFGDWTSNTTFGPDWNWENVSHGLPTHNGNIEYHAGDLGNLHNVQGNSTYYGEVNYTRVHLNGTHNIVGRAIGLFEHEDRGADFQPDGDVGSLIAVGIIAHTGQVWPPAPSPSPTPRPKPASGLSIGYAFLLATFSLFSICFCIWGVRRWTGLDKSRAERLLDQGGANVNNANSGYQRQEDL
jgi:Cu/Zn superoxide dismutase